MQAGTPRHRPPCMDPSMLPLIFCSAPQRMAAELHDLRREKVSRIPLASRFPDLPSGGPPGFSG